MAEGLLDNMEAVVGGVSIAGRGQEEIEDNCEANLGQKDKQVVHFHAPLPALAKVWPVAAIAAEIASSMSSSVGALSGMCGEGGGTMLGRLSMCQAPTAAMRRAM